MSSTIRPDAGEQSPVDRLTAPRPRRDFLKWTGAAGAAVFLGACADEDTRTLVEVLPPDTVQLPPPPPPTFAAVTLNFANDFGVLNYAYALEQLEAAFYIAVTGAPNYATLFSAGERAVLEDLRDHEIAHREFFKAALTTNAIPALTPNFTSVNLNSRLSVLQAAQTFEDLGVWAYNGAARFLSSADFLRVAGKIVSVEARHAAAIRDILAPLSFAPDAFDMALPPSQVLPIVQPFIRNTVTVQNLPAGA